jgi:hypothetical protein
MTTTKEKPTNVSPEMAKEIAKIDNQFNGIEQNLKGLTLDKMNTAPVVENEYKMSEKEIGNSTDIYLKPVRSIGPGPKEKFNEKFRQQYEYAKEYVNFIAYNNMIGGEDIELWTKPFPGVNCDFWKVP